MAEVLVAHRAVRLSEARSVPGVKELGPELQPLGLSERKRSEQGDIEVTGPVHAQVVSPFRPKGEGGGIRECGRVEPINVACRRGSPLICER